MRILALSGSLGHKSSNTVLLQTLAALAPPKARVHLFDSLAELPYFNPDLDREGMALPEPVRRLREELAAAQALLIATPEYAHGVPGVLKNALDWLVSGPEMPGKPIGLVFGSASSAQFARASLIEILTTMSARVIQDAVLEVPGVRTKIGKDGRVTDPEVLERLRGVLEALLRAQTGSLSS